MRPVRRGPGKPRLPDVLYTLGDDHGEESRRSRRTLGVADGIEPRIVSLEKRRSKRPVRREPVIV